MRWPDHVPIRIAAFWAFARYSPKPEYVLGPRRVRHMYLPVKIGPRAAAWDGAVKEAYRLDTVGPDMAMRHRRSLQKKTATHEFRRNLRLTGYWTEIWVVRSSNSEIFRVNGKLTYLNHKNPTSVALISPNISPAA